MDTNYRDGIPVVPKSRISKQQIDFIDSASLSILNDPGIICYNEHAADVFKKAGCRVSVNTKESQSWCVRFSSRVVKEALKSVPAEVVLGARNPKNRLKLNAHIPNVYFGTGSEANIILKTRMADFIQKDNPNVVIAHPI